jgi:hypothetical protein
MMMKKSVEETKKKRNPAATEFISSLVAEFEMSANFWKLFDCLVPGN